MGRSTPIEYLWAGVGDDCGLGKAGCDGKASNESDAIGDFDGPGGGKGLRGGWTCNGSTH